MKIVEREAAIGTRKFYEEVDLRFLCFSEGIRVLPAPYFEEPNVQLFLKAVYPPNIHPYFKNGGYEVYDNSGAIFNYDLDQLIVHPYALNLMNYFSDVTEEKKYKVKTTGGKRGRPRNPNTVAKPAYVPTGNPRGRKRGSTVLTTNANKAAKYVPTGGKRGRKPLNELEKAAKLAIQAAKTAKSGGKRGRPAKKVG